MVARYMLYSGPNMLINLEEKDHGNFERVTPLLPPANPVQKRTDQQSRRADVSYLSSSPRLINSHYKPAMSRIYGLTYGDYAVATESLLYSKIDQIKIHEVINAPNTSMYKESVATVINYTCNKLTGGAVAISRQWMRIRGVTLEATSVDST